MRRTTSKSSGSSQSIYPDTKQDAPASVKVAKAIQPGHAFFFRTKFINYGKRFLIDFALNNKCRDIGFRLYACMSPSLLIRNSRINFEWGLDEQRVPSWFNLATSEFFEVQIFFDKDDISVAFDCMHVVTYKHRVPFEHIRRVEIQGDIQDISHVRKTLLAYPLRYSSVSKEVAVHSYNLQTANVDDPESGAVGGVIIQKSLSLPIYASLGEKYELGSSISITARVRLNPNMFKIALQVGECVRPQPITAIQLEFWFSEAYVFATDATIVNVPVISVNSFNDSKWGDEVTVEMENGLKPLSIFNLLITRGAQSYQVRLNNQIVCDYPYIINPTSANICFIDGGIERVDIAIEKQ